MTKDDLLALCNHIRKRQEDHGVDDAFRFVQYHSGQEMTAAAYGTRADEEHAAVKARKAKRARAADHRAKTSRRKGKQPAAGGSDTTPSDPETSDRISISGATDHRAKTSQRKGKQPAAGGSDTRTSTPSDPETSDRISMSGDPPPTPTSLNEPRPSDPPQTPVSLNERRPAQSTTPQRKLRSHRKAVDTPTPRATRSSTRGLKRM